MIIHQTLCDLFPPASFDPAAALPLTPADFIGHVLVPEAAVRLIMEDLALGRADAIKTLRESVEYGVAMFPADEGEGGRGEGDGDTSVLTAGERIIMERARARRKELEEEERREAEEERRAQSRAGQTDTEPDMDVEDHAPPSSSQSTKPKPRLVSRRKPPSSEKPRASRTTSRSRSRSKASESDDGVIDVSSDTGHSTDASRSGADKRRRKARDEPPSSKSDAPTDPGGVTPKPKPRPRPRAIGRAALGAAASQPDVRSSQRAEVDVRMPASDPPIPLHDDDDGVSSSSQSVQFLSWDRKPLSKVRRGQTEGPVDATPRPKARLLRESETGKSLASSSEPTRDDAGARPRYPLQMAKERRQER